MKIKKIFPLTMIVVFLMCGINVQQKISKPVGALNEKNNIIEIKTLPKKIHKSLIIENEYNFSFDFDEKVIMTYSYKTYNLDDVDISILNTNNLNVSILINEDYSRLNLSVFLDEYYCSKIDLFIYSNLGITEFSYVSDLNVFEKWLDKCILLGKIQDDYKADLFESFMMRNVRTETSYVDNSTNQGISPMGIRNEIVSIGGQISVFDPNAQKHIYLDGFTVKIFKEGDDCLKDTPILTTETMPYGFYYAEFVPYDYLPDYFYVAVFPENETYSVNTVSKFLSANFFESPSYYITSELLLAEEGRSYTTNIVIDYNLNQGYSAIDGAFSLAAALSLGQSFYYKKENITSSNLPERFMAIYPADSDDLNNTYYGDGGLSLTFAYMYYGLYDFEICGDWLNAIHEYTHFLQYYLGIYSIKLTDLINGGVRHSSSADLAEYPGWNNVPYGMEKATRIAWTEGWGYFYPLAVYQEYFDLISGTCFDNFNTLYNDSLNFYVEENSQSQEEEDGPKIKDGGHEFSETQENAITTFLLNFYNKEFDFGDVYTDEIVWNLLTTSGVHTFSDFIDSLYESDYRFYGGLGDLLNKTKIGPGPLTITSYYDFYSSPTIQWNENGSSKNPLNKFKLALFKNYTLIDSYLITNFTPDENGVITYKIPETTWSIIKSLATEFSRVSIAIAGYNERDSIETGPYYSNFVDLYIPQINVDITPEMTEFYDGYPSTEINEDVVLFDEYTVSTKRLRAGFIQNECINLSPRREGAGLAYLEFDFGDDVVREIDIDISFWSDSEYFTSTDSSAYIQYYDEFVGDWVTSFDLLADCVLSTDRTNPNHLNARFIDETTHKFRIYAETEPIGNVNKGRISIHKITAKGMFNYGQ